MDKYVKGVAEVTCVLLIATFAYDFLSANCFKKTHTYRCFKQIRNSKTCKKFLKRLKKKRKRCWKCSIWSVYDTSLQNSEAVIQLPFGFTWPELKNNTVSLVQEGVTYMEKKFPALQSITSVLVQTFMNVAADTVNVFSRQIKKFTETVIEYTTKTVR